MGDRHAHWQQGAEALHGLGGHCNSMRPPSTVCWRDVRRVPFYVGLAGLVLSPCWDQPAAMLESFLDDSMDVAWMTWPEALAAVWQDESSRNDWLNQADQSAPGLRQRADAIRHARLSSI